MSIRSLTVEDLLSAVAARTPAPGGGAVAPLVAAVGAALGRMVVNYSLGKRTLAEHEPLHRESLEMLERRTRELLELADADAEAYERLNALQRLDPDDETRRDGWTEAVLAAIDVPLAALRVCDEVAAALARLDGVTSPFLRSDLVLAAILTDAAARSSAVNVRINLPLLEDEKTRTSVEEEVQRTVDGVRTRAAELVR